MYHCAAGKDRTGVVSAVLLGLLGVPDPVIVADYAATKENLDAIVERLMSTEGYYEMLSALPPDTMHAEPETMVGLPRPPARARTARWTRTRAPPGSATRRSTGCGRGCSSEQRREPVSRCARAPVLAGCSLVHRLTGSLAHVS